MNFELLDNLSCRYGTPYYFMNSKIFIDNIIGFQNAFKRRYELISVTGIPDISVIPFNVVGLVHIIIRIPLKLCGICIDNILL